MVGFGEVIQGPSIARPSDEGVGAYLIFVVPTSERSAPSPDALRDTAPMPSARP